MITLCIPTLSRYDLLERCILSAEAGIVKPDRYLVMDNGGTLKLDLPKVEVVTFGYNIGVAKAWNYFIKNSEEIRIISNDDIMFYPNTISTLVSFSEPSNMYCTRDIEANSFSLFVIGDDLVNTVGYFDEEISPNYAYFEDNDYHRRMDLAGRELRKIPGCTCGHFGSATLKSYSLQQQNEHHIKFRIAQANYEKKWGGSPGNETFSTPHDLKEN
jgi:GT2 family glycosyltransferase